MCLPCGQVIAVRDLFLRYALHPLAESPQKRYQNGAKNGCFFVAGMGFYGEIIISELRRFRDAMHCVSTGGNG